MPATIGRLLSSRMCTLAELDTIYSVEDAYTMLEVLAVDDENRRRVSKAS